MKVKVLKITLSLLLVSWLETAFAIEVLLGAANTSWLDWVYDNALPLLGAITILAGVSAIVYLNNQLMAINKIRLLQELGLETVQKLDLAPKEAWWHYVYKRMTRVVPIEQEQDVMLDHNYDGIRELDNILPPWWVGMFYASIVFGVLYFGYFHFTDRGYSSAQEYAWEVEASDKAVKAYLAQQSDQVDENSVVPVTDDNELALGSTIFLNKCVVCHGAEGQGGVGPNLTDPYWIHGGDIKDIFKTIKYGVPEKGMISWKSQLRASDMQKVASFILTLVGTNPPDPKAPEGDLWQPEQTPESAPETAEPLGLK